MEEVKTLSPQKKAWITRRKNQKNISKTKLKIKELYIDKQKENQRDLMIELIRKKLQGFEERNPLRNDNNMISGIYLESPRLLFTKLLEENKLTSDIFFKIPNNIEYEKFFHGSRKQNAWGECTIQYIKHEPKAFYQDINNVILINNSYGDLINMMGKEKKHTWNYIFIWADYCGTFSSYYKDIESTFKHKLLGNGSIFAMTFSARDAQRSKKLSKYSTTNCIVAVNDFVINCAKKYGYEVVMLPESGFYKSGMYTAIFDVKHNQMSEDQKIINKYIEDVYKVQRMLEYKLDRLERGYREYEKPMKIKIGF